MSDDIVKVKTELAFGVRDMESDDWDPHQERLEASVQVARKFPVQDEWNIAEGQEKQFARAAPHGWVIRFSAVRRGSDMVTDPSTVSAIRFPADYNPDQIVI